MAQKFDDSEGVWRTIGGRRVFIRTGQSLSDAMKESGKFKTSKKEDEKTKQDKEWEEKVKKLEEENAKNKGYEVSKTAKDLDDELRAKEDKYLSSDKGRSEQEKEQKEIKELHDKLKEKAKEEDYDTDKTNWRDDIKAKQEAVNKSFEVSDLKKKAQEVLPKEDIDTHEGDLYLKKTKESEALLENLKNKDNGMISTFKDQQTGETWYEVPFANWEDDYKDKTGRDWNKSTITERDAKDLLKQLNDEGSDFTFDDRYATIENGKIKTNVGVFMPDERGYVNRDLEIPIDDNETYNSLEEKLRDWQYRHDTPDAFEDEDFPKAKLELQTNEQKSTNETMNEKIRSKASKKSTFKDDLPKHTEIKTQGTSNRKEVSENIQAHILDYYDSPQDFLDQMDAISWQPTNWHKGQQLAEDGFYEIYYDDQRKFLDDLKINPKGKNFDDTRVFETYKSLIGRESAKLYDRLQKNAYNKYKQEHPLTKMSLEEFIKSRKK